MRVLIIPDLHHHVEHAEHWLTTQTFERVIFLGDYFDDYDDGVADAERMALWLRQRMKTTDDIFLLGNHDAAYLFPKEPELFCPGFTTPKARAIRSVLGRLHWSRFQLAHEEQGWLLSHAGFHPAWMKEPTVERILQRCDEGMEKALRRIVDPILGLGEVAGGILRYAGPLWMDRNNLQPIPGIDQIVGHTPDDHVRENSTKDSRNFCLDVGNASVAALLCDGELAILSAGE